MSVLYLQPFFVVVNSSQKSILEIQRYSFNLSTYFVIKSSPKVLPMRTHTHPLNPALNGLEHIYSSQP